MLFARGIVELSCMIFHSRGPSARVLNIVSIGAPTFDAYIILIAISP